MREEQTKEGGGEVTALPQSVLISPSYTTRVSITMAFEKLGKSRIKAPGGGGGDCTS